MAKKLESKFLTPNKGRIWRLRQYRYANDHDDHESGIYDRQQPSPTTSTLRQSARYEVHFSSHFYDAKGPDSENSCFYKTWNTDFESENQDCDHDTNLQMNALLPLLLDEENNDDDKLKTMLMFQMMSQVRQK